MKTNAATVKMAIRPNSKSWQPNRRRAGYEAWKAMVSTGGPWDQKVNIKQSGLIDKENPNILFGEYSTNYQAVANMHFGYVGNAAGFWLLTLDIGAGFAQKQDNEKEHIGPGWGDDPFDKWWIHFGYALYDEFGENADSLLEEEFDQFLADYIKENGEPPEPLGQ